MAYSLEKSLGFVTNRVANRLKYNLEQKLAARGYNITPDQWGILSILYEQDGIAQYEIAERLSRDKTNIARILTLLERHQLVERRVDEHDSRINKIYLSPLAHEIENGLRETVKEALTEARAGISDEELSSVIDILNRVFENIT